MDIQIYMDSLIKTRALTHTLTRRQKNERKERREKESGTILRMGRVKMCIDYFNEYTLRICIMPVIVCVCWMLEAHSDVIMSRVDTIRGTCKCLR